MADLSRLAAPVLREGNVQAALRAVYSYLYQQTEQLQYVLGNLDESNLSEAMQARLARLEGSIAPPAEPYPVGAVYCCAEGSPAGVLGGEWERIEDYVSPSEGTAICAWRRVA